MTQQFKPLLSRQRQAQHTLLVWFCLQLVLLFGSTIGTSAQGLGISGANVEGTCPAACGIKIQITNATLTEANDGMFVNVEWTLEQTATEIKLKNLKVFARVKLGIDNVENTLTVASTARKATLKLSRNLEFDFKDVEVLTTKVVAFAEALPPIPVTNIPSRKITGQGNDSAVEVSWTPPAPLPCSASSIAISVAATNEKGDRLTGKGNNPLSARSAKIDLKGDTNKKGLHNPEATVQVINSLIGCEEIQKFPPKQAGIGSGTGSSSSSSSKVTIEQITFQESSGRVDSTIDWEVAELGGVKATSFNLKFDLEDNTGKITTTNRTASGTERSRFGPQVQTGGVRSLTVTITATFRNSGNTVVLTKEDKKTQAFSIKGAVKPVAELAPNIKPVLPKDIPPKQPPPNNTSTGDQSLTITQLQLNREPGRFLLHGEWQIQLPAGVTVNTFAVENSLFGDQRTVTRTQTFAGNQRQGDFVFGLTEAGNIVNKAQLKITANLKRADGSSFQVTQLREVVPPGIPATPAGLSVTKVQVIPESTRTLVHGEWQLQLPAGATIATFDLEATLIGNQRTVTRKGTFAGSQRNGNITFILNEAGTTIKSVQLKVVANLKAPDGSSFQQTATGNGN